MIFRALAGIFLLVSTLYFIFSCSNGMSVETQQYATIGQKLYGKHCQNCHGNNGEGLGNLYPPLRDSIFLNQNRNTLACIIKNGMNGPVEVAGITYNQQMPAFPELSSLDIAYLLTYITTHFGNSKTHFKQAEIEEFLKNCQP